MPLLVLPLELGACQVYICSILWRSESQEVRLFGGGTGSRELLVGAKAMGTLSQSPREVSWGSCGL